MGLWETIQGFFRDAKVTEFYVKISKEEFQGNLPPEELNRERRRYF
jgi:hypothetical protein